MLSDPLQLAECLRVVCRSTGPVETTTEAWSRMMPWVRHALEIYSPSVDIQFGSVIITLDIIDSLEAPSDRKQLLRVSISFDLKARH